MIGRFADWFNSRRRFISYLLYAEWVLVVTVIALITATSILSSAGHFATNLKVVEKPLP